MDEKKVIENEKVPFEEALNRAGFGIYSIWQIVLTGLVIVAFSFLAYSNTIIMPISACELATNSYQQGLIGSAPIVGLLIGAMPWGYLGDTRGRRNMLITSLLMMSLMNILRALSVNWVMMLIMEFVVNLAGAGLYMLSQTLLSECVPQAYRNMAVLLVASICLPSQGYMGVLAIPVIPLSFSYYLPALGIYWNSWRTLQLIFSIPAFITAVCVYFSTESPKFKFVKGDEEGAMDILKTIYRRNNRKSKEEFQVKGLLKEVQKKPDKPASAKDQFVPLFKSPLLKFTIIMTTLFVFEQVGALQIWFPTIANNVMQMVDMGAPMNQTICQTLQSRINAPVDTDTVPCSLNNTAMLILLLSGGVQSVANVLISSVVTKLGRRNIVIVLTAFCGLSGILVNLVANTIASTVLLVLLLLGYSMLGLYTAIAVALFPTHVRALAIALVISGGRVATIAAIQVISFLLEDNCDVAIYAVAVLFAGSSIVASFLPDDRRRAQELQALKQTKEDTRL